MKKLLTAIMKSPKTTIAGIGSVATGIGGLIHDLQTGDFSQVYTHGGLVIAGVGLILGKDADKSHTIFGN